MFSLLFLGLEQKKTSLTLFVTFVRICHICRHFLLRLSGTPLTRAYQTGKETLSVLSGLLEWEKYLKFLSNHEYPCLCVVAESIFYPL